MKKKLQVFISSTYEDLKEERKAATDAILSSGHIPVGMEWFPSGLEKTQTIKTNIKSSDVYILILGGRYGTTESNLEKSYTQLEYEYAISKKIPVILLVIDKHTLNKRAYNNKEFTEQNNPDKYIQFKNLVLSKNVSFFKDTKDIKYEIARHLNVIL